ncbi:hypothetical protein C8Q74DRAFT_1365133 [Fomes fomentarius]|nr:hypothetical protein C8Q74DRAFT_1365133 [Fomes fomentarius]
MPLAQTSPELPSTIHLAILRRRVPHLFNIPHYSRRSRPATMAATGTALQAEPVPTYADHIRHAILHEETADLSRLITGLSLNSWDDLLHGIRSAFQQLVAIPLSHNPPPDVRLNLPLGASSILYALQTRHIAIVSSTHPGYDKFVNALQAVFGQIRTFVDSLALNDARDKCDVELETLMQIITYTSIDLSNASFSTEASDVSDSDRGGATSPARNVGMTVPLEGEHAIAPSEVQLVRESPPPTVPPASPPIRPRPTRTPSVPGSESGRGGSGARRYSWSGASRRPGVWTSTPHNDRYGWRIESDPALNFIPDGSEAIRELKALQKEVQDHKAAQALLAKEKEERAKEREERERERTMFERDRERWAADRASMEENAREERKGWAAERASMEENAREERKGWAAERASMEEKAREERKGWAAERASADQDWRAMVVTLSITPTRG